MNSVFIAGSREILKLNPKIRERLDNILKQNLTVLVGDANGADKAVQKHLAKSRYPKVEVYCMDVCRNNVGNWQTHRYAAEPESKRDRHYYGIKDLAMARDADCGFMLWDGKSKGTLANIVNLLNLGKKTLLYLSPKKQFLKLSSFEELEEVLHAIGFPDSFMMPKLLHTPKSVGNGLTPTLPG